MWETEGMETGATGAMGERGHSVAEVQLFKEDVVQSVAQPSMVGVVSKVGGDSDSEDSSDSEYEEEEISEGAARVCWINADESMEQVGDLRVIDRAFLHGDIVAKASEPLGNTGTVVDVEMMVDLELPNGEIVRDVNSRRLRRVRAFAPDDYVIYGMWIGRIEEVDDNLTVLFDDGAKCKVSKANPDQLSPLNETGIDDLDYPYFQGQKVQADSASIFKKAKWLKGSWKANRRKGTVVELEAATVIVNWICSWNALNGNLQPSTFPDDEVDASKLLPIIYFSHMNWQLGDRSLPPTVLRSSSVVPMEGSQVDEILSDGAAESSLDNRNLPLCSDTVDLNSCRTGESSSVGGGELSTLHRRKGKQQRRQDKEVKREKKLQKKEKPIEYAVLIVSTRTTVDVLWQDGRICKRMDACSLVPVDHLGDQDFWPEQYVMERGADGEGLDDGPKRVGVVKTVNAKQRTASVRWLKSMNRPEEPPEFESEELVSVYELVEHPDYSYSLGDVVTRLVFGLSATDDRPEVEDSKLAASYGLEDSLEADPADNDNGAKVEPPSHDLSWAGVIIGLQDGAIEVAWADGMVSKVGPQAIRVVDSDPEDSSSSNASDVEDAEDLDDAACWKTLVSDDDGSKGIQGEPVYVLKKFDDEQQFADAFSTMKNSPEGGGLPGMEDKVGAIKHFDGVNDASDHYYISETSQPTNSRKWAKKIQQEWSILEKNLPDAIYVRVYEDRMDLLRAVVVGPKQTPYHDGLFVFDLYMPPEYPSVPPVAHYHSGGLRLNPNLYESGKVCLSLLNTWTGSGSERWHRSTSSILQVLVSIQGLILNEKPYFNEAGYDKQVGTGEGEKNSLLYNENSFLLLCKSMLYLLRRPPMHFEDLIRDHFEKRGQQILLACRAYLAGAEVGSLMESDFSGVDNRKFEDQSSAGFKLMLNKLVPKLAAAFEEVSAIEPLHEPSMVQADQEF